jgi:hypothetical protein
VLVTAVVTAACGGGGGAGGQKVVGGITPDARAALKAAAEKTAAADSAKLAISFGVTGSGFPGDAAGPLNVEATGSGVVSFSSKSGDFTIDLAGIPATSTSKPVPSKVHMLMVDGVSYMEIPAELQSKAPPGKKWVKLDPKGGADALGFGGAGIAMPGLSDPDPAKALAALQALGDTKSVGAEKIRGVDTTHYVTQLNLGKALGEAGATGTTAPTTPNPFAAMFDKVNVPVDAWVDDAGLVRKIGMNVDLASVLGPLIGAFAGAFGSTTSTPAGGFELRFTMAYELYDYGTPVHVTAPPAPEVTDSSVFTP